MVKLTVTYVDGKSEVFKDINDDSIEVKNGILSFDEAYGFKTYRINFSQVRNYRTDI